MWSETMNDFSHRVPNARFTLIVIMTAALSVLAVVVPAYATSSPAATQATFPGTLTLRDGKVTAYLKAVPLDQVMTEMSRLSGVQVVWVDDTSRDRPVSVGFTDLPLLRALDRLLDETNFVLFYADGQRNARLTYIWIAAQRHRTEPRQSAFLPTTFLPGTTFTGDEPIDALIQTALYAPDPKVRARMVASLGLRDHEDDRVRSTLSQMAFEDSDPTVCNAATEVFYSLGNQVETEEMDEGVEGEYREEEEEEVE
jgi:hypothetical protein